MDNKKFLNVFVSILILILVGGIAYIRQNRIALTTHGEDVVVIETQTGSLIDENENSGLIILVPDDIDVYSSKMTEFTQMGGTDPLSGQVFVQKILNIPYSGDIRKASAELAAQQFPTGGGPEQVLVNYFKVSTGTAYVVLNIDEDGRAGVSVSIAKIHPVVEKTLRQFPDITNVVFGYASGDVQ